MTRCGAEGKRKARGTKKNAQQIRVQIVHCLRQRYKTHDRSYGYSVDIHRHLCSCEEWQVSGYVCSIV